MPGQPGKHLQSTISLFFGLLLALALVTPLSCLAIENVTVVLSEDGAAYSEFSSQLNAYLNLSSGSRPVLKLIPLSAYKSEDLPRTAVNQLLVAVGTPAMTAMAQKPPAMSVLNVLVPRATFQKIARQYGRHQDPHHFSAIYFDQPWNRQLALIRATLPGRNRVGILLGKDSSDMIAAVQLAAREMDLQVNLESVTDDSELLPALRRLLSSSDSLLALPDAAIYNRNNIPSILLTSYRQKVPLFGFSAAYVKAGALAGVYSSPGQIAQQLAEIILGWSSHAPLPSPQYPRYYSVGVNTQVSRSLSLEVEDENQVTRKLKTLIERAQ